ncbi:MAG: hypothetical protein R3Y04_03425 [Rikenellaceae bacterium]
MIKLGDRVKFINDIGVGKVIKIEGKIVTVDREDGFEVPALISELVVVEKEEELRAISRIGVSDPKPGRVQRNQEQREAHKQQKRQSAISRYGRITITNEYEDEDEPIDIASIRENYARSMANTNQYLLNSMKDEPVNDTSVFDDNQQVISEKEYTKVEIKSEPKEEQPIKKAEPKPKKKSDMEVIDLHAHEILETEQGMSAGDILNFQIDTFKATLESKISKKSKGKVVFIHGVGSGKLKQELTKILRYEYPRLYFQDASFKEYGYGAIMVIF